MQELRYRAGASTILDLLDAQVSLAEAEAGSGPGPLRHATLAGPPRGHPGPQTLLEQGRTVRSTFAVATTVRTPLSTLALGAVLVLGMAGCKSADDAKEGAGGPGGGQGGGPPAMPVEVVVARADTVVDAILATGQIEAMQSVELRPDIEGRIDAILVREGSLVSRGQPLFKVDDAELKRRSRPGRGGARPGAPVARPDPRSAGTESLQPVGAGAGRGHVAQHRGPARRCSRCGSTAPRCARRSPASRASGWSAWATT